MTAKIIALEDYHSRAARAREEAEAKLCGDFHWFKEQSELPPTAARHIRMLLRLDSARETLVGLDPGPICDGD